MLWFCCCTSEVVGTVEVRVVDSEVQLLMLLDRLLLCVVTECVSVLLF